MKSASFHLDIMNNFKKYIKVEIKKPYWRIVNASEIYSMFGSI